MAKLQYLRIPLELRQRRQWAVASMSVKADGKPDKAPRNPATGALISSTDRNSWVSFEEAANSGYPAIGYMLDKDDPYAIIDLDKKAGLTEVDIARQHKIYSVFETYAERSQSGHGVHIVMRGTFGGGFNKDGVEVYDQERFIIFTGDVCRNSDIIPLDELLQQLVSEMGETVTRELPPSGPETMSDDELIARAETARNGENFKRLFYNKPQAGDDWSRLDAALAQMIAFYTRNHDQALRVFRRSALYRPNDKGKNPEHYERYYLMERTFARAFKAEQVKDADIEHGRELVKNLLDKKGAVKARPHISFPQGLVGDVAKFIMGTATRPVPEIAIAGALAFCSGLYGRQYNVSNTGLNLYIVLIAATGRGKEGAATGVDMLMSALRTKVPSIDEYRGPGHIASGQGLVKHIDNHPSSFSFLGEFGQVMRIITAKNANAADVRTKQVLLDLFGKSGQHQTLHSSVYSDTDKNTKSVQAPCFSFMGDTTPDGYYDNLNEGLVNEGLIPRFLTITYTGPRVARNDAPVNSPDPDLLDRLVTLFTSVANMAQSNTFAQVAQTAEAAGMLDAFDHACDERINSDGGLSEMWNRAHLKALRIAAVLAVGRNHFEPVIQADDVTWAVNLVNIEITELESRFERGDLGEGAVKQDSEIETLIRDYVNYDAHKRASYGTPKSLIDRPDLIPYTYFRRRLRMHKAFSEDRRGLTAAVKSALKDACDLGLLVQLSEQQVTEINAGLDGKRGPRITAEVYSVGSQL